MTLNRVSSPCEDCLLSFHLHLESGTLWNPGLRCLWWEFPPSAGLGFWVLSPSVHEASESAAQASFRLVNALKERAALSSSLWVLV